MSQQLPVLGKGCTPCWVGEGSNGGWMCFRHPPPRAAATTLEEGVLSPATGWAAGGDVPATPRSLAMVSLCWHLKSARNVGLCMAPGHFMQVLFCGTTCPLCHPPAARAWGRPADTQATTEVSVLLVEVRSAQGYHPTASREFSMSPESQQGNSNYVQGTRVQNKPKSPAGRKSLAK